MSARRTGPRRTRSARAPRPLRVPGARSRRPWPASGAVVGVGTLAGVLSLVGCASTGGPDAPAASAGSTASASANVTAVPEPVTGEVVVLAAASLTESFTELATRFEQQHPEASVTLGFGASSALATQITEGGVPADVLASASVTTMDDVVAAGAAADPVVFARNELAIAVPAGNPAGITSLADLARPGVSVALCQAEVPCGSLADSVLAAAGVVVVPVTREADVKATLAKVVLGEVDAGLVYATDVRAAGGTVGSVAIPADVNASTDYPVAVLADAPNPVAARAFVELVLSAEGAAVLGDAGFAAP